MTTWQFLVGNWHETLLLAWQHAWVVAVAVIIAIFTGVPIGVGITFNRKAADIVLYLAGIIMTIPAIALFGIMIPLLSIIGHGIGVVPAIVALVLYAQLPIIRNTHAAICNVAPDLVDAGMGMGMTGAQVLFKVKLPLALGVIFAGVRVAVVMSIGIGAIAAYIGAGGLGQYIFMGITQTNDPMINSGAICVAAMAVAADALFGWLENRLVSRGLKA